MRIPLLLSTALALLPVAARAAPKPGPAPVDLGLEYRAQHLTMKPLSLNDLTAPDVAFVEQRLRLDGQAAIGRSARIVVQADLLDGVLFGDNGSFVGSPRRNRGALIATRSPNLSRLSVDVLDRNVSTLDPDNYGLVLAPAPPLEVNHVYGEVRLPVGLLRVGRQPLSRGRTVLVHGGQRINRWGVSRAHDSADSILFATKLSAIADAAAGLPVDPSLDRGLFLAVLTGQIAEQGPATSADDLYQVASTLFYTAADEPVFGLPVERLDASLVHSYRTSDQFDTELHSATATLELETEHLRFVAHHTYMLGQTREVSEALALLGSGTGEPALQDVSAWGGIGELAFKLDPVELVFEWSYASGDDDPSLASAFTQLTQAEDNNVGLHLFENVLAYQTERAVRLGMEALKSVDPQSYPLDALSSRGALVNGIALFPQVLVRPWDWLDLRAGVMFAFTHLPSVDPIGSMLHSDGVETDDDLRNFCGGTPGDYWGTEYDVGLTLKPADGFALDLEGAWLQPGDALQDEHGDAVDSFFLALRFTWWTR